VGDPSQEPEVQPEAVSDAAEPSDAGAAVSEPVSEEATPDSAQVATEMPGDEQAADGPTAEELEGLDDDASGIEDEYDTYQGDAAPIEEQADEDAAESEQAPKDWYILKVQSNREKSICAALQRRVAVAGLDEYFDEIVVPTEDVAEFKNGKRRVVKRKLYPGYIVVHMALTDETWFLVRETTGIGDFTGAAGKPTPMLPEEVDRIVKKVSPEDEDAEQIKTAIPFKLGDRVRIKEGTFENFEGDVEGVDEANGRVTVMINIFGRSTPVELEHWQIEAV
jgi:transcriptional antiterminator NusG